MKTGVFRKWILLLGVMFSISVGIPASCQNAFQNLDFELPTFVPSTYSGASSAYVLSNALPGWTGSFNLGQQPGDPVNAVGLDNANLDEAAIFLVTTNYKYGLPGGLIYGKYAVLLQGGVWSLSSIPGSFQPGFSAAISQFGQIPPTAKRIAISDSLPPVTVTFAGTNIPLVVLQTMNGWNVYGGDVSQFAGQTGELTFSTTNKFNYLDDIEFFPDPLPISLNLQLNGNNLILSWNDPSSSFSLYSKSTIKGTWTNVPAATSPYTNVISGRQQFFQLQAK